MALERVLCHPTGRAAHLRAARSAITLCGWSCGLAPIPAPDHLRACPLCSKRAATLEAVSDDYATPQPPAPQLGLFGGGS